MEPLGFRSPANRTHETYRFLGQNPRERRGSICGLPFQTANRFFSPKENGG